MCVCVYFIIGKEAIINGGGPKRFVFLIFVFDSEMNVCWFLVIQQQSYYLFFSSFLFSLNLPYILSVGFIAMYIRYTFSFYTCKLC